MRLAWIAMLLVSCARPQAPARDGLVFVLGEVNRPGPFPTWSAPTVAQAVSRAGGKTVLASHRARVRRANVSFLARWEEDDVPLEPGDVVFVEPICAGY